MKNRVFCAILAVFLNASALQAQVYFAAYRSDQIFVGPANVDVTFDGISAFYVAVFQNEVQHLQALLTELDTLEARRELNKSERRRLANLKENSTIILSDIENISQLIQVWEGFDDQLLTNTDVGQLCFTPVDTATAALDGLALEMRWEKSSVAVREFVELSPDDTAERRWVKKHQPGTGTDFTDGKLVWCLEPTFRPLQDMNGTTVPFERREKFAQYAYDEPNRRLVRLVEIPLEQPVKVLAAQCDQGQVAISKLTVLRCGK